GHDLYIEPQCFKDYQYKQDERSDIYAIGILLWELTSGKRPFKNSSSFQINSLISSGKREQPISGTPSAYIDLYTKCWDEEPTKRPDINTISETLSKIKWETSTAII